MSDQKFERIRCVGRGQFGTAYLVQDSSKRKLVLKEINICGMEDEEKKATFAEVDLLRSLDHINIVKYYGHFFKHQDFVILMEYCGGGDLAGYVKAHQDNPLQKRQILDWFVQLSTALHYIHAKHILHRDLKCQNVFLSTTNILKLGDFGIAKVLDSTLSKAQTVLGTPYYMSPEVCENKPYSYKSDLWALGVILYQLCTRKNPFQSENLVALVFKIVKEDPEPIPVEYGSDMTELVDGLLTKDVDKRWGYIEISKCPAFDQHTKSEHAGKSVGKKLTREQRKQQRMEKKRRMREEHAQRLAAARREQALRTQQVKQRTMRHFNTDLVQEAKPACLNMPEAIVENEPKLPPAKLEGDDKGFPELDHFSSKAFESQIVDDKTPNEFLKQFIFNEPLIITASCFDRVDWDGSDDVASPKAAYESPDSVATPGSSGASSSPAPKQKERAISSTGVYDWRSDPNAFPEGAFADTLPEGKDEEDESKADVQADTPEDLTLYNTVKSDYSDAFDSDEDDPSSSTTVMADKAEALQNIRDAGIAMSKPFTPKTPLTHHHESPQRRGQGRLQAELYHMRHDALQALGRSEFDRLHALMLERWKSHKALNHDALLELAKGDEKVSRHLENLLHLITVEEMMKVK